MSKTIWGVILAAVIMVVILLSGDFFAPGEKSLEAEPAPENVALIDKEEDSSKQQVQEMADAGSSSEQQNQEASNLDSAKSEAEQALEKEAESYVQQLTETSDEPIPVESADAFVKADRPLSTENITDETQEKIEEDEPYQVVEIETSDTEETQTGEVEQTSTTASNEIGTDTEESDQTETAVTSEQETLEQQTPEQNDAEQPVTKKTAITVSELLESEQETSEPDSVYYVHTVLPDDDQGIWGIIHHGIIENFAKGLSVKGDAGYEVLRVDIPPHADELVAHNTSSFLGVLISEKSQESYVYNFQTERIGKNPDFISPGQEIVIVNFTPKELISIYKHFSR